MINVRVVRLSRERAFDPSAGEWVASNFVAIALPSGVEITLLATDAGVAEIEREMGVRPDPSRALHLGNPPPVPVSVPGALRIDAPMPNAPDDMPPARPAAARMPLNEAGADATFGGDYAPGPVNGVVVEGEEDGVPSI